MTRTLARATATWFAFSWAALVPAQDDAPAAETAQAEEPIEEVVVRGRRTLFDLRRELQDAHEHVWDVFNEINSNDDFDIECLDTQRAASRMKRRVCRPHYANVATAEAGKRLARRMHLCAHLPNYTQCLEGAFREGGAEGQQFMGRIKVMDQRLDEEFRKLVRERPELAQAIMEFLAKEREYEEEANSREDSRDADAGAR